MSWQLLVSAGSLAIWLVLLLVPWRPWAARPVLEADTAASEPLDDVTALVPARNEAELIETTLTALLLQGPGLRVIVIDDGSGDDTAVRAGSVEPERVDVLRSDSLPGTWTGKLWALEQGRRRVRTPYTLLLDADIELLPGLVSGLRRKSRRHHLKMISLMARLDQSSFWSRLLMPAFIYFFKLLYPFALVNDPRSTVAAAAGGCILVETAVLNEIGGFAAIRGEIIDDCALARMIKARGHPIWLGLTDGAVSRRKAKQLCDIWLMVARTAFTQLRYSAGWLSACTGLMVIAFWVPPVATLAGDGVCSLLGAAGWTAMAIGYAPTLRFYGRKLSAGFFLPVVATLYLAMTWHSAIRHWSGSGVSWKNRTLGGRP